MRVGAALTFLCRLLVHRVPQALEPRRLLRDLPFRTALVAARRHSLAQRAHLAFLAVGGPKRLALLPPTYVLAGLKQ